MTYTERELRDITMAALGEFASIPDSQSEVRKRAQVVLDRMRVEDRLSGPAEPDQWRQQVTPDLDVVVDAAGCIVLEVSEGQLPGARVLRRVTVTDVAGLTERLALARMYAQAADGDSWRGTGEFIGRTPGAEHLVRVVHPCTGQDRHSGHEYDGGERWCEGIR